MYRHRYWNERNHAAVARYRDIAAQHDTDPVTFAVAWTLANPAVTSAIVGASRPEQLAATLAAAELKLGETVLAACDAVAAEMGYAFGPFQR